MSKEEALEFLGLPADASREAIQETVENRVFKERNDEFMRVFIPLLARKRVRTLVRIAKAESCLFDEPLIGFDSVADEWRYPSVEDEVVVAFQSESIVESLDKYSQAVSAEKVKAYASLKPVDVAKALKRLIQLEWGRSVLLTQRIRFASDEPLDKLVKQADVLNALEMREYVKAYDSESGDSNLLTPEGRFKLATEMFRLKSQLQFTL